MVRTVDIYSPNTLAISPNTLAIEYYMLLLPERWRVLLLVLPHRCITVLMLSQNDLLGKLT